MFCFFPDFGIDLLHLPGGLSTVDVDDSDGSLYVLRLTFPVLRLSGLILEKGLWMDLEIESLCIGRLPGMKYRRARLQILLPLVRVPYGTGRSCAPHPRGFHLGL